MAHVTPEILGRLIDTHLRALELYAAQWTNAPADVVQEAFIELASQAVLPERPAAWLHTVVRHRAINAARSDRRRRTHEAAAGARLGWRLESSPGNSMDAEAATAALRSLPDDQREAILLRLWSRLTLQEIAEVAGVSTATAYRRYQAGIAALRERLSVSWLKEET